MIDRTVHDDVDALRFSWWRSNSVGMAVHAFLVRGVLVDCGFPAVASDVEQLLDDRDIRGAMVTHQHEDHAGNVGTLATRGIPLAIPAETLPSVQTPAPIAFYRGFTWEAPRPVRASIIRFADDHLSLLPAPGHSPDHHVVWDRLTDTLFAGDLFLGVKVRVAHEYADPRAELATLRSLIDRRPARMFCAHRGLVPNAGAALQAKADWTESIILQVEQLAASGHDVRSIRRTVLGARGAIHWFSNGEYSPDHLVRAILRR